MMATAISAIRFSDGTMIQARSDEFVHYWSD